MVTNTPKTNTGEGDSSSGATVSGIPELLEKILVHSTKDELLLVHQKVCREWRDTISSSLPLKRLLFLTSTRCPDTWIIDKYAAHHRIHGRCSKEAVVLGVRGAATELEGWALVTQVPCDICEGREPVDPPVEHEHTRAVLHPIRFNPLFCVSRQQDLAASLDERASRAACTDIDLRVDFMAGDAAQSWQDMLITQPACTRVRAQVELDGTDVPYDMPIRDDFEFSDAQGLRLGTLVAAMKRRLRHIADMKTLYWYDFKIFVPNAVEIFDGDEEEVARRTSQRQASV